jgi:5-methylcytosine-specific restriction enzyme A
MARLTTLKPRVQTMGKVARATDAPGWAATQRGSRHARGYGTEWDKAVKRIRARDSDTCQQCVRTGHMPLGSYSAVDHKVPRFEGGSDDDTNLEVICKPHHDAKTALESARARGLA